MFSDANIADFFDADLIEEPTAKELGEIEKEEEDESAGEVVNTDSMHLYLKDVGRTALISHEREIELGEIIAQGGEAAIEARNELVKANLRLVMHCAKKFKGRGVDIEDLNAMGTEGLFKAASKYDHTLGYKFSTYATWWINQAISRGICDEGSIVRIPVHMSEVIMKVRKAEKILEQENGYKPTLAEIIEYTGLPESKVLSAYGATYNMVSFDARVGDDGDSTVEDFLKDENAVDPCGMAMSSALRTTVREALGYLTDKEALVIRLRYGIGGGQPKTLEEIANMPEFRVTRERIRQIEVKALRKLRRNMHIVRGLSDFAG